MTDKLKNGKSDSTSRLGWRGIIKTGMCRPFEKRLDKEVRPGMQIGESKHLMNLTEAGKVCLNRMRVQVSSGMCPDRELAKKRKGKWPR
jgi:hypothetical protein